MKFYSQVLTSSDCKPESTFTEEKLKKVAQEAMAEEDRLKNIMVFEVGGDTDEDLSGVTTAVFEEISEKPTFEAVWIGKVENGKVRLVRVSLCSFCSYTYFPTIRILLKIIYENIACFDMDFELYLIFQGI
jgi:hypothetical protein